MADNRLLIRCTFCGLDIAIARLGAGDDAWSPVRTGFIAAWGEFLVAHDHGDGRLEVALTSENDRLVGVALHTPSSES